MEFGFYWCRTEAEYSVGSAVRHVTYMTDIRIPQPAHKCQGGRISQGYHGKHRTYKHRGYKRPEGDRTQLERRESSGQGQAAMATACCPSQHDGCRINQGPDQAAELHESFGPMHAGTSLVLVMA